MDKYYCIQCKAELDKSEVRAEIKSIVDNNGNGSPTFYNRSKYYCAKHNLPVETRENGFIQIPILVAIIVGLLVIGSAGYGIKQYQNYQSQKVKEVELAKQDQERKNAEEQVRNSEIEKLKNEVESLKNKKPQIIIKENSNGVDSITNIITEWRPKIAHVICRWNYSDGSYIMGAGSGTVMTENNVFIVTNKHVVIDEQGNIAASCTISLPGHSTQYLANQSSILIARNGVDMGTIGISNPDEYIKSIAVIGNKNNSKWCQYKPQLGEGIVILGYPGIGSQDDITVTEGIISGYDGNYYITSAKIEHGNSGGIAISVKNNCYVGIPSYAVTGSVESLSRILDAKASF